MLLVEDEGAIAALMEETFADHGFDVAVAGDAGQAMALIEAEPRGFALVVTDVQLGRGGDGFAVARYARAKNLEARVVYMTGAGSGEAEARGVPGAVVASKPFMPEQLVADILGRWGGELGLAEGG